MLLQIVQKILFFALCKLPQTFCDTQPEEVFLPPVPLVISSLEGMVWDVRQKGERLQLG